MTPKAIFTKYLKDLAATARHDDAREESFYPRAWGHAKGIGPGDGEKARGRHNASQAD